MCGYDPFYWYEKDLDEEYRERFQEDKEDTRVKSDKSDR